MEAVLDRQHVVPAGNDGVIERDVLLSGEGENCSQSHFAKLPLDTILTTN